MDSNAGTNFVLPEEIQASWNSGEDGSNAIMLPGTRKRKSKGGNKGSKMNKKKEAPILSKTKQKKLKQLEEEKRNKLLQQKSIEILEKHKIWDGAYSILQSSGTMGQAETFKTRRLRAVQLSKAGLEVSEDKLLHKRKKNNSILDENEVNSKIDSDPCFTEKAISDCATYSKRKERQCDSHGQSVITETYDEGQKITYDGVSAASSLNSRDATELEITNMKESQTQSSSTLTFNSSKDDNKLEDKMDESSPKKGKHACDITSCMSQDHTKATNTIVISVSRPHEVEEKRKELPIIMMEQEIMEAINENFILILCGETGCGKTTQVPQFLYEAGYGTSDRSDRKGIIGVTQPRRVAVLATAKRVAYELGLSLGKEVGFQVRHDKLIGKNCSIKFMTDGILLREVQSDFLLKKYSIIILDEAHERSLNTDILIGMLSRVITLRQKLYLEQQENIRLGAIVTPENRVTPLKLVLMSATLRVDDFKSNRKLFNQTAPVLEVPTRQFPVAIHFSKRTNEDYIGQAYKKVISIHKKLPPGGILVFVTGQREVELLCKKLLKASSKKNSGKSLESELTVSVDLDMKEIDEAFDIRRDSPDQHTDTFNTYEEDVEDLDSYCPSSDSSSDSELNFQTDDEETVEAQIPENAGLILDFLRDDDNFASLQASFDALAGNSNKTNVEAEESLALIPSSSKDTQHIPTSPGPLYVLPLYAMLPASSQLQVFEEVPEGERLVVVATNVAETSLTIPGIKYVVDTGKEKVKNYNYKNGVASYEVTWISKASAAQRAGRAGRTGPGHCYRLYSSGAFSKDYMFPQFSCPEILKTPVDGVVLLMKSMSIDKVANFPFPSPPDSDALLEAEHCLKAIEALDSQGKLTPVGRAMAQYPMSPRHSRMLLTVIKIMKNKKGYSRANFLLGYAIASVAALSFANPFIMQFGEDHGTNNGMDQEEKSDPNEIVDEDRKRQKKGKAIAKEARARFSNPTSDVLTIAYALQLFELAKDPSAFCRNNSLNLKTMEDISKLRKQLLQLVFHQIRFSEEFSWDHGTAEDVEFAWRCHSDKQSLQMTEEELLGQAICAGWSDRIAKRVHGVKRSSESDVKVRAVRYQSCALNDIVYLHRQSSVSRAAPEYLVYTELLQTKRPYMHGITSVKPDWLVRYGSFLCTFSAPLTDPKPYYEPMSDRVFCWISPTFGRHNWPLPLHNIPFKNDDQSLSVFAAALLEGLVLPCLKSVQNFLVAPPSLILRPEGMGQRRVSDLLKSLKIGSKTIDSRALLREVWDMKPEHLKAEIQQWFQERYRVQFENIWERMHSEVRLEGYELFPKRVKKERKSAK